MKGYYGLHGWVNKGSSNTSVRWNDVDWALLQNNCVVQNQWRFSHTENITATTRIHMRPSWESLNPKVSSQRSRLTTRTARTAIVLRAWDTYRYTQEDMVHIRSIISEAALGSAGRYAVFLLVHLKQNEHRRQLNKGQKEYDEILNKVVPREFRNMAVLFDETLLESWYEKVEDHRPEFQMYQALQLFANVYQFDYYWQLEMDMRILMNTREYFDKLADFASNESRTQAFQRATYRFMPSLYPTYDDFMKSVNIGHSSSRSNSFTRPEIPEIPEPFGVDRPPSTAQSFPNGSEPFGWGVSEPADLIITNTLVPVLEMTNWPYKDYVHGFSLGADALPRLQSPVSMARCSAVLLNLIHDAQFSRGLALPSEATSLSYASYHGLKISYPPVPFFMRDPQRDVKEMETLFNGGPVEIGGKGAALYDPIRHWDVANDGTWHWGGAWPREIMDVWLGIKEADIKEDLPWILRRGEDGRIWAPGLMLHPVKTNS